MSNVAGTKKVVRFSNRLTTQTNTFLLFLLLDLSPGASLTFFICPGSGIGMPYDATSSSPAAPAVSYGARRQAVWYLPRDLCPLGGVGFFQHLVGHLGASQFTAAGPFSMAGSAVAEGCVSLTIPLDRTAVSHFPLDSSMIRSVTWQPAACNVHNVLVDPSPGT
ncbi:hypothetical protein B0H14DRAFT_3639129 [Mycena olivaceomarginata]|nr:hypothetical protein B0H14DRAFT_3639129 [Mycena olivaceomarginata]